MTAGDAGLRIRRMTHDDVDAVMAIAASLNEAPHWPRSSYAAAVERGGKPERIALVAAVDPDRIAGFLIAALIPPQSELESIAISPEFQRGGVARELVLALRRELQARSCNEILLEVRTSNRAARAFYSTLGWVETGCRPGYYSSPVDDAILMRLDLERAADQP